MLTEMSYTSYSEDHMSKFERRSAMRIQPEEQSACLSLPSREHSWSQAFNGKLSQFLQVDHGTACLRRRSTRDQGLRQNRCLNSLCTRARVSHRYCDQGSLGPGS